LSFKRNESVEVDALDTQALERVGPFALGFCRG
jgi:hypothetical protein